MTHDLQRNRQFDLQIGRNQANKQATFETSELITTGKDWPAQWFKWEARPQPIHQFDDISIESDTNFIQGRRIETMRCVAMRNLRYFIFVVVFRACDVIASHEM